jgi:uncharacterized integral membrane protein
MRQINFVIIFVICLALVLFGIENTDPAVIRIVKGIELQAPLSVELILAMGIGAVLAWVFSVWTQLQRALDSKKMCESRMFGSRNSKKTLNATKRNLKNNSGFCLPPRTKHKETKRKPMLSRI